MKGKIAYPNILRTRADLFRNSKLKTEAKLLFLILLDEWIANGGNVSSLSQQALSEMTGLTRRGIYKAKRALKKAGFLTEVHEGFKPSKLDIVFTAITTDARRAAA